MTFTTRRASGIWQAAYTLGVAVLLTSCGGGSGSNANPAAPTTTAPPPAPAPTPRLLQQGGFTLRAPTDDTVYYALATITDPAAGRWEASVDWTFNTNTLWMWVANGACTAEQFNLPECPFEAACPCQFVVRSEASTPKPRALTITNAAGGTRTLFVMNMGPREESGNYTVTLTPSTSATAQVAGSIAVGPERVEPVARRKPMRRPR